MSRGNAPLALVRYEELIVDPRATVERAVSSLAPELVPEIHAPLPSFLDLQLIDPAFFRRGMVVSYRDEMPHHLHELFWAQADNARAMEMLRYGK